MKKDGVDGSAGDLMELLERLIGIDGHAFDIPKKHEKKNVGIRRQRRDALQHLVKGKVAVKSQLDAAREWLGCFCEGLLPKMFERRRPDYDFDILGRGRN